MKSVQEMRNGQDVMEPTKGYFSWFNVIPLQEDLNCSCKSAYLSVWIPFYLFFYIKETKN